MTNLYPYQLEGVKWLQRVGSGILADELGLGKAQPVDCKVLTPTGWKLIGEIGVGDEVIGSCGNPIKVIGVFPQGILDAFEVEFKDGSKTRCCENHLWETNTTTRNARGNPGRILSLQEIKSKFKNSLDQCLHYIPMVKPVNFKSQEIEVHPYLLGYLIANGCFKFGHLHVCIPDEETRERVVSHLPIGMELTKNKHSDKERFDYGVVMSCNKTGEVNAANLLIRNLRKFDLMEKGSHEKSVPSEYMHNSVDVRLNMLQGLMDGDGYAGKDGVTQYSTSSEQLSNNVIELIQSLGGVARHSTKIPTFRDSDGNKKEGMLSHIITVALPPGMPPFQLGRKKELASVRSKYPPSRGMTEIRPAGKSECVCIQVDAPNELYVTDDYIVTHNTYQSLYFAYKCLPDDPPGPIVVVCPSSLKLNWKNEAYKHLGLRTEILYGEKVPPEKLAPLDKNQIYIINYDILCPDKWKPRQQIPTNSWLRFLIDQHPRLLIADESHILSSARTMRTRAVKLLARNSLHTILLTGTPIQNKPQGFWSQLNIVRPKQFPSQFDYCQKYCHAVKEWYGWRYYGAKNLDQLHKSIDSVLLRRLKKDVLQDLPEITHTVIPVEIDLTEYRKAEKNFLVWLRDKSPLLAANAARAEEIVKLTKLKELVGELKRPLVIEWIKNFQEETGSKLIIGAVHYSTTYPLKKVLGKRCVIVDGTLSDVKKNEMFHAFNNDDDIDVLIGNYQAAGKGWNCTSTSDGLGIEMPWVPADIIQFAGRFHGLGRGVEGQPAHMRYMVAENTIDADLCELLQRKKKWMNQAIDGIDTVEDFDIYDKLKEQMKKRH